VKPRGAGFTVNPDEAAALGLGRQRGLERHIRLYLNGRDLSQNPRSVLVIDLFGFTAEDVRARFPEVYSLQSRRWHVGAGDRRPSGCRQ
jgi:hypothetical protein